MHGCVGDDIGARVGDPTSGAWSSVVELGAATGADTQQGARDAANFVEHFFEETWTLKKKDDAAVLDARMREETLPAYCSPDLVYCVNSRSLDATGPPAPASHRPR